MLPKDSQNQVDPYVIARAANFVHRKIIEPIVAPVRLTGQELMRLSAADIVALDEQQKSFKAGQVLYDDLTARDQRKVNPEKLPFEQQTLSTLLEHHYRNAGISRMHFVRMDVSPDVMRTMLGTERNKHHLAAMAAILATMKREAKKTGELPLIKDKFTAQQKRIKRLMQCAIS